MKTDGQMDRRDEAKCKKRLHKQPVEARAPTALSAALCQSG